MKVCAKCKEEKDDKLFYLSAGGKLRSQCKLCSNILSKAYKKRDRDNISYSYALDILCKQGINRTILKKYPELIEVKQLLLLNKRVIKAITEGKPFIEPKFLKEIHPSSL